MTHPRIRLAALAFLAAAAPALAADAPGDWPRFRGPNGAGISDARTIPTAITDKDIRWRVDLGGEGHSSPVVVGKRLFITCSDRKTAEQKLLCVDAETGKTLWSRSFASAPFHLHQFNSFSSASCAADAERVYCIIESNAKRSVVALTHDGAERWRYELGPFKAQHGAGVSPIGYRDAVIACHDHAGAGVIVALDAATGNVRWKLPRPALDAAYATPVVMTDAAGHDRLITASQAAGLAAVDPATGSILWQVADLFPKRVVSSPVLAGDRILITCGQGGSGEFMVAVTPPTAADAQPAVGWKLRKAAPYVPTGVYFKGNLYIVSDGGIAQCIDPATGEPKWQQRLGGDYFASPVVVDSVIYAISREGKLVTFKAAADRYTEIARSDLGEQSFATPAIAHGRMYLRTLTHLICVGGQPVASNTEPTP